MTKAPTRSVIALLLAASQLATGCWSKAYLPSVAAARTAPVSGQPGVVLAVSEAGVAWGDGSLGSEVEQALRRSGFDVAYPVEPVEAPALRLEVRTLGDEGSSWFWGLIGVVGVGAITYLILPVLFWPFVDSYQARCSAVLLDGGAEVQRFEAKSKATVFHALLADAQDWRATARAGLYRDLADQIASQLVGALAARDLPDSGSASLGPPEPLP